MPFIVIIGLVLAAFGGGSDKPSDNGPLGVLKVAAPPNITAQAKPCTSLIEALPLRLKALAPRQVEPTPATPFVLAWGDPAVVVRCGVDKPAGLTADDSLYSISGATGPFYDVQQGRSGTFVFTVVDRAAFVSVTIPKPYTPATYVALVNTAIVKAMPTAVCSTSSTELDASKLCASRKG